MRQVCWPGGREVFAGYRRILKTPGIGGTDYLRDEGGAVILFNMGINGMVATAFLVLVGGDLNGPTIGGIMTIVGFSATGKHLRNILPVMGGVFLAGMTKHWELTNPSATLALLFSTTLAPIARGIWSDGRTDRRISAFIRGFERWDCLWRNEPL